MLTKIALLFLIFLFPVLLLADEVIEMDIYSFYWGNIRVHPPLPYKLLENCEKKDEGSFVKGGYKYRVCIKNIETLAKINKLMEKIGFSEWKESQYPEESKVMSTTHAIVSLSTLDGKKWSFCITQPWEKKEAAIYWFNTPEKTVPDELVALAVLNLPNKEFQSSVKFVKREKPLEDYEYTIDKSGHKNLKAESYTVNSITVYITGKSKTFSIDKRNCFDSSTFTGVRFFLKEDEKLLPDLPNDSAGIIEANYIFEVKTSDKKFYFAAKANTPLAKVWLIGNDDYAVNPRLLDFFESMIPISRCSQEMPINLLEYSVLHSE